MLKQLNSYASSLIVIAIILVGIIPIESSVFGQTQTDSINSNATASNSRYLNRAIEQNYGRVESSNNPQDIATLAYIWGYPLVSMNRLIDFSTNPIRPQV